MYPTLCNSAVAGNRSLFIRAAVICLLSIWPQCNSCAASFGTEWPRLFRLRIRIAVGGCGLQLGMWAGRAVWASGCQRNWVKGWLFHKPSGTSRHWLRMFVLPWFMLHHSMDRYGRFVTAAREPLPGICMQHAHAWWCTVLCGWLAHLLSSRCGKLRCMHGAALLAVVVGFAVFLCA